jgi:hypothetical protein
MCSPDVLFSSRSLVVLVASDDTDRFIIDQDMQGYRPAAHLAVLDVGLLGDRTVNAYVK